MIFLYNIIRIAKCAYRNHLTYTRPIFFCVEKVKKEVKMNKLESLYKQYKKVINIKWVSALKKIMLFSAVVHMIMIGIYSFAKLNTVKFNFFDILDLDLFFPQMIHGNISQISSVATFCTLYVLIVLGITFKRRIAKKRAFAVVETK
jgi:hypothetical protein